MYFLFCGVFCSRLCLIVCRHQEYVRFQSFEKQIASHIRLLGGPHHQQTVHLLGKSQFSEMQASGAALLATSSHVKSMDGEILGQIIGALSTRMYLTANHFRTLLDSVHELAFQVVSHLMLEMISGVIVVHLCKNHFLDTLVTAHHRIVLTRQ